VSVFEALDPETVPAATAPPETTVAPAPTVPAAPADAAPPADAVPPFRLGQIVKTSRGLAIVVKVDHAHRPAADPAAGMVEHVGYVVAALGATNAAPCTAEELGLEAI